MEIYQGDCLDILPRLKTSVDFILADPPYGTTQCRWDSIIDFRSMWKCLERFNAPIVLFSAQPFSSLLVTSNIKNFKYQWVWQKDCPTGHLNSKKMPLRIHEQILVFYRNNPTYNPQFWESKKMNATYKTGGQSGGTYGAHERIETSLEVGRTKRFPIDVIKFNRVNGQSKSKTLLSTQKPVPLLEYLIRTYTNEDDTVLDFCMGSGSTGIAAINNGRNFIGIEKDMNHFKIAAKRIREAGALIDVCHWGHEIPTEQK